MKQSEITLLMKGMAPVIGKLIGDAVQPLMERIAELEQQIKEMPTPRDGVDGVDGKDGADGRDGADGAPGRDGKDAEPVTSEQLAMAVAEYLGANPPAAGKDGRDGIDGKDGVGLAGAVQSKDGHLVLTLTSGATVDIGMIAGRDGRDGEKGVDGLNGRDGFGFDDLDLVESDEGVQLRFTHGEVVKDFALPVVFDRGVYREGGNYRKGNGVTWGGSYWIAQKDDPGKPDTPESGWRLAVKKGQNGKDLTK